MHSFFRDWFEAALSRGDLDPDSDPDYRAAYRALEQQLWGLPEERQEAVLGAALRLADCSDVISMAYAFRVAAQILAAPLSRAACATAAATAGHGPTGRSPCGDPCSFTAPRAN